MSETQTLEQVSKLQDVRHMQGIQGIHLVEQQLAVSCCSVHAAAAAAAACLGVEGGGHDDGLQPAGHALAAVHGDARYVCRELRRQELVRLVKHQHACRVAPVRSAGSPRSSSGRLQAPADSQALLLLLLLLLLRIVKVHLACARSSCGPLGLQQLKTHGRGAGASTCVMREQSTSA